MSFSKTLQIIGLQAQNALHKVVDAVLPSIGADRGSVRSSMGFYSLISAIALGWAVSNHHAGQLEDDFEAASKTPDVAQSDIGGFRIDLPRDCSFKDYYLVEVDDKWSLMEATPMGAKALKANEQFKAATEIDGCFNKLVHEAQQGEYDLASEFKVNGTVDFSNPVEVTNRSGGTQSVLMATNYEDAASLDSFKADAEYINSIKGLRSLWRDEVYNEFSPDNMGLLVDENGQSLGAEVDSVKNPALSEFKELGLLAGTVFGTGLLFTAFAGHSPAYRRRREERKQQIAELRV